MAERNLNNKQNANNSDQQEPRKAKPSGFGEFKRGAVIIGYPCDESLWCGGTVLLHSDCTWIIFAAYCKEGTEQAEKFRKAVSRLNANAKPVVGGLENPEKLEDIKVGKLQYILDTTLPSARFDIILTHSLWGEYCQEKGTDKIARAVTGMTDTGQLSTKQVWMLAYEDRQGQTLPKPTLEADKVMHLPEGTLEDKRSIITDVYGYPEDSVQVKAASKREAFWVLQPGGRT
jgi:hypothetical protein